MEERALILGLVLLGLASVPAHGSVFAVPENGATVIGEDGSMTTVYEDTLPDLAQRYSLGYYEIIRANPRVDVWIPGAGKRLTLPGRRILPRVYPVRASLRSASPPRITVTPTSTPADIDGGMKTNCFTPAAA